MKVLFILFPVLFFQFYLSAQTTVQTNGQLSVVGNQIVNQHGQTISFAGTSLFWSNYSTVDLTDIYHGIYLVKITEGDYTITKKIIVE